MIIVCDIILTYLLHEHDDEFCVVLERMYK